MSNKLGNWSRCGLTLCLLCGLSICFAPVAVADNVRLGYVSADSINVRAEAAPESEVIGTAEGKTYVAVTGGQGSFFEIRFQEGVGYISSDFSLVFDHQPGVVNADKVILRSEPSTDSRRLTTLNERDSLNIYGEENGFYQVTFEDKIGFVAIEYVDGPQTNSQSQTQENQTAGLLEIVSEGEPIHDDKPLIERSVMPGHYTEDELYLVAQLIQAEGSGSSVEGYEALASVVFNRLQSSRFPNSVEDVCYQSGQFTVVRKSSFLDSKPSQKALDAVMTVFVEGKVSLPEEVMFFKSSRLSREWGSREYYATIGGNMYYS